MYAEMDGMEVQTEHTIPAPPFCPHGQIYTVVTGDSLFLIAQRFGISLQELIAANPQIENPNLIFPGQMICVPAATFPQPPPCPGRTYTVVAGDTLFEIAQRFGVSLQALLAANPQITNPDLIFPGQVICIPVAEPSHPLPPHMPCPEMPVFPPVPCPEMPVSPPMPCPEMPFSPPVPWPETPVSPWPEMPVSPPMPYPEPVMPIMPEPVPCPPRTQGPYPAPLGVPMPEPYYLGSFIYAYPPVNWEECPYARFRRRRRRLSLRRRRA